MKVHQCVHICVNCDKRANLNLKRLRANMRVHVKYICTYSYMNVLTDVATYVNVRSSCPSL